MGREAKTVEIDAERGGQIPLLIEVNRQGPLSWPERSR
jgi:hypothetical protein